MIDAAEDELDQRCHELSYELRSLRERVQSYKEREAEVKRERDLSASMRKTEKGQRKGVSA